MNRLNLEQFKAIAGKEEEQNELEKLTGGVLGDCHMAKYVNATPGTLLVDFIKWIVN